MSRRLCSFFLLIAFLWQSFSGLSPAAVAERVEEFGHATLHWQDTGHYHHDDDSLHIEDAGDATQHQHADTGLGSLYLLAAGAPEVPGVRPGSPVMTAQVPAPWPFLEGLLRPPRAIA